MDLYEGLRLWLAPKHAPKARRCLFVGAGFTKATDGDAPLFVEYGKQLVDLMISRDIEASLRDQLKGLKDSEIENKLTDIIELVDLHVGRVELARQFIQHVPRKKYHVYRTVEEWKKAFRDVFMAGDTSLTSALSENEHLTWLTPSSPNVLAARLMAEHVIDDMLSTNWDAYIEFGAAISGLRVTNADDGWSKPSSSDEHPAYALELRVIESPDEMNLHWAPPDSGMALYKLHGGVRSIKEALGEADHGKRHVEERLRSAFLVANSDLIQWRDSAQWIADRVGSTLRSSALLTVGVSGEDTVVYDAFRRQIRDYEQAAKRKHKHRLSVEATTPNTVRVAPPRLVAIAPKTKLRQSNMFTVRGPYSLPRTHIVDAGGVHSMRALYAMWLLDHLCEHAEPEPESGVAARLERRLREDILRLGKAAPFKAPIDGETNFVDLLTLALGPNARWTAILAGAPPFTSRPKLAPESSAAWWYAPWCQRSPPSKHSQEQIKKHYRPILGYLDKMAVVDIERVDPRTGTYTRRTAPREETLLLPWPWHDESRGDGESAERQDVFRRLLGRWLTRFVPMRAQPTPRVVHLVTLAWPEDVRPGSPTQGDWEYAWSRGEDEP